MKTWRDEENEYTTNGKETQVVKRDKAREATELENALLRKKVQDTNANAMLFFYLVLSGCIFLLILNAVGG